MTSEVALMNRMAVALAADSAATHTFWESGERKQRYFKGSNKIFNLSTKQPVGLMINGAGSLQRMPWEVIVKAYRESRDGAAHAKLEEYSSDFFKFLANKSLFPADYQERELVRGVCETAGNIAVTILKAISEEEDADVRRAAAQEIFQVERQQINEASFISPDCEALADDTKRRFFARIQTEFSTSQMRPLLAEVLDVDEVLDAACKAYFKQQWTDLDLSGLVIAGYGTSEFFPCLEQYECFGVVLGKVIYRKQSDECKRINYDVTSEIVAIAQDDMVKTFVFGVSLDALIRIGRNYEKGVSELIAGLRQGGHLAENANVDALLAEVKDKFRDRNKQYIWENHAIPLRRVVGMLPVDELASLAETFVAIESLKERVTRHTETVSGPIDVAVITKGDGFIWIKRKHYFDPELNLRFVAKKHREA